MRTTTVNLTIYGTTRSEIETETNTQLASLLNVPAAVVGSYVERIVTQIEEAEGGSVNDSKVVTNWVADITVTLRERAQ